MMVDLVDLALETGMRRSELLAIRSSDIDWDSRRLNVPETKNGSSRTVPLTHKATTILSKYSNANTASDLHLTAFLKPLEEP